MFAVQGAGVEEGIRNDHRIDESSLPEQVVLVQRGHPGERSAAELAVPQNEPATAPDLHVLCARVVAMHAE